MLVEVISYVFFISRPFSVSLARRVRSERTLGTLTCVGIGSGRVSNGAAHTGGLRWFLPARGDVASMLRTTAVRVTPVLALQRAT